MFATLALVYAIQTHTEEVSRLRTLLPNGAVVLVTHRPTADNDRIRDSAAQCSPAFHNRDARIN